MKGLSRIITFAKTKKQKMKNIKTIILTATIAAMAAFSSCTKDPCETKTCQNGGATQKVNADSCGCNCTYGYTGGSCETLNMAVLSGTFSGVDTVTTDNTNTKAYSFSVTPSGSTLKLSSFWRNLFVNDVNASVSGNTFTIASQDPDANGKTVTGNGTISFNASNKAVLHFSIYTVSATSGTKSYQGVFTQL